MHLLEQMLLFLSERIRDEMGNFELIEAAQRLASESHNYARTSNGPDPLHEMHEEWVHRFGMPHRNSEPEAL
jgi:hypothetical protein